jgi:hypothetical protein
MATSTPAKSKVHSAKMSRLRQPVFAGKGKGAKGDASAKDGPQLVGGAKGTKGAKAGKRAKPNPVLLGVLGVILLVGLARVAMPSLFGGGSSGAVASFPAPITNRHLVPRVTAPKTGAGSTAATTVPSRPPRDPFTPPPGFGS